MERRLELTQQRREPLRARSIVPSLCLLSLLGGCTIVARDSGDTLVANDAPVYDTRFRDLDPDELDLSSFWIAGSAETPGDAIPIHHRTYADIVEAVSDGIVNLYTTVIQEREALIGIHPADFLPIRIPIVTPLLEFIPFQMPIPFQREGLSLGSGFLINDDGFILTNAHVVRNATDIRVVRSKNREEYLARIIGVDPQTDIALLRIEPQEDMKVLPLGDSGALDVGEIVVAVGNPLGLNHTVSSGLISAKERIVGGPDASLIDYLQTDSAINPGSSGGPLLNLRGEVVGINTAIASDAQNIGFAIPIDTVKSVMPILVSGRAERGWFGASARPAEPGEANELGHPNPSAVIVEYVFDESPASRAGVHTDDLILRIGDQEVTDFIAFRRHLIGMRPGQTLELTLLREGAVIEVSSTLAKRPTD
jgi:serine protease Do